MTSLHRLIITLTAIVLIAATTRAQDLSAQLSKLGQINAPGYLEPLLGGWGSDLNSALYHSADLHDVLGFDIGVKFAGTIIKDADRTFMFQMPDQIVVNTPGGNVTLNAGVNYPKEFESPSAAGTKTAPVVSASYAGQSYTLPVPVPGGFDLPTAPLFVPQVAVGLPFGFEVIGRFIPTVKAGDVGKVNYLGIGVRHSIDRYVPKLPVDIAVHVALQSFNFKDSVDNNLISASALAYGLSVSKKVLFLTVYGGVQLEQSTFTVGPYTANIITGAGTMASVPIPEFEVKGNNTSRATLGVRVLLAVANVHAEYSFAKTPVFAVGVGVSLR